TPTATATPTPAATPTLDPAAVPAAKRGRPPRPLATQASPSLAAPPPQPPPVAAAGTAGAAAPGATPPRAAEPEREQAGRIARAFLEALAAGDASKLAEASSERFSFDGEVQSGREAVRRTWRSLLAGRPGPPPSVNGIEVLAAQEAMARYGKPPSRVAALARAGAWIALGDVGGRPVVLFVARENGRMAVLGIHD
ncbi:MAG TPA: hypothetical protein VIW03_01105, partial [Anaeromyxobacter sp.]